MRKRIAYFHNDRRINKVLYQFSGKYSDIRGFLINQWLNFGVRDWRKLFLSIHAAIKECLTFNRINRELIVKIKKRPNQNPLKQQSLWI